MVNTGERLQLAAASGVTILSTLVALHFSQPAFTPVPPLDMPGAIFVGVKKGSASAPVRVDVELRLQPSPSLTSFDMFLRGDINAAVPPEQAGDLMVGFCGAMKDVQLRRTSDGEELRFDPPIAPSNLSEGSVGREFSLSGDCVMTTISKQDFSDQTLGVAGIGWAVSLEGETTAPTEAVAGSQHRYAFPRIATLTLPVEILAIESVTAESVVSIEPKGLPAEYVPTVSSPEVEDPTAPIWGLPLHNADRAAGFELNGVDQRHEAAVQRDLFLASASAGTAGGGLIWFFGSAGPFVDALLRRFRKAEAPVIEEAAELTPSPASENGVPDSPTYRRLIAASLLSGVAGSTLAWLFSRRKP
ncbi:hypothetical protein [Arthrobacter sp. Cr_A7]|uniref:hypothetical protein n=1 Tax=Arthrobacter sp. Cr_A7 TaxID=3031017 RepID=UPI0023DA9ADE|nr:hypothetical protein [Arthrobacter sp. Cr_A7]MDF2048867.1 hypothetical protein [Arthrobacter sp. Cr_A7]